MTAYFYIGVDTPLSVWESLPERITSSPTKTSYFLKFMENMSGMKLKNFLGLCALFLLKKLLTPS